MKTFKKWLALLMAGVLLATSLASCAQNSETREDDDDESKDNESSETYKGLSPEEVYDALIDAKDAVLTVRSNHQGNGLTFDDLRITELDGNKVKETYTSRYGDEEYNSVIYIDLKNQLYFQEEDEGEWYTDEIDLDDAEDLFELRLDPLGRDILFEDNCYEADGDLYEANDDAIDEYIDAYGEDIALLVGDQFDLTIRMEEDDEVYTFTFEARNSDEDAVYSIEIEIEFSMVSVKLPEAVDNGGDDDPPAVEPMSPSEKVPDDLNFSHLSNEERMITIAYVEGGILKLTEHSLVVDETNMDPTDQVDLAVQARNQAVEAQLGVTLEAVKVSDDFGGMSAALTTSILAGYGKYDILAGYQYYTLGMAHQNSGLLIDLNDLRAVGPDAQFADYIDLDAPYWATAYNDALSYKNHYYWITGDIALRYMGGMYCTFVNSATYADKLEGEFGSIYDIAKNGNWTIDLMMQMAEICSDAPYGYGFGYELQDPLDALALASGVQFSWKDPNTGDISLVFNNDHTQNVSAKLTSLLNAPYAHEYGASDSYNVMTNFAAGNVAFTVNKLYMSQIYLNEFDDFYVVPVPKFNEDQANYITAIHDGVTVFAIPIDCPNVAVTAAALELMVAYSAMYVKPAYYDGALKGLYVRDPQAAEMIDLIHATVNTDFAMAWSASINDIGHIFRSNSKLDSASLARKNANAQMAFAQLLEELEYAAWNAE